MLMRMRVCVMYAHISAFGVPWHCSFAATKSIYTCYFMLKSILLTQLLLLQVHAFSPNTSLVWRECASIPIEMTEAMTSVIDGMVYVGGGIAEDDEYQVCKYDPVKNEWIILPPAPLKYFGIGRLNGKLVIVGGRNEEGESSDVHVFEEDRQQWANSIPPMPTGLVGSLVVTHNTSLVVCGISDESSSPSMFVYNSQSSQWNSRAPPPLTFHTGFSSAVVVNDTYYTAVSIEGTRNSYQLPSSPAVFSHPLSTLLDPDAPSAWQRMPDTPCHSSCLAATGGCLLALGGLTRPCNVGVDAVLAANLSSAVHAYCPATSSWVKIGDLPDLRVFPAITTLSTGELLIAGGVMSNDDQDGVLNDSHIFIGNVTINTRV